jgi:hypothetical protein
MPNKKTRRLNSSVSLMMIKLKIKGKKLSQKKASAFGSMYSVA